MKLCIMLFFSLMTLLTYAMDIIPSHIKTEGTFKFSMKGRAGELHFGRYIKSPSQLVSAIACTLQITADDDYYNTYLIELNPYTF